MTREDSTGLSDRTAAEYTWLSAADRALSSFSYMREKEKNIYTYIYIYIYIYI
jgi:hypothetical protein